MEKTKDRLDLKTGELLKDVGACGLCGPASLGDPGCGRREVRALSRGGEKRKSGRIVQQPRLK